MIPARAFDDSTMIHRFYCPSHLAPGVDVELPPDAAHHAEKVLRLRQGERVQVFDGDGSEYAGLIQFAGKRAHVQLERAIETPRESPLAVTLVQALAVADKMDWIVQKAVELGAQAVQPIAAERSVLRLEGERAEKRVAHWQQVAIGAAEQCGRSHLTPVRGIRKLAHWLADTAGTTRWVLHPEEAQPLTRMARPQGPVAVLVGPEGGWSPAELAMLKAAACQPVTLGPRVLRTETAGLAMLAAMHALWGDY